MTTLYTFGPSHYCEKARWALDLCGLAHKEQRWAPGPHLLAAKLVAPGSSVPILRVSGGTYQGSDKIIDWLEGTQAVPWTVADSPGAAEAVAEIEARTDRGLGVAIRRLVYAMTLPSEGGRSARQLFDGVVWWQRPLARLMWPVTRQAIMKGLNATAEDLQDAEAKLEAELEYCDSLVADGRRFLVADRFTRADISLASLISPITRPPEHPVYPTTPANAVTEKLHATYGARPCVRWAAAIYRDCRSLPIAA